MFQRLSDPKWQANPHRSNGHRILFYWLVPNWCEESIFSVAFAIDLLPGDVLAGTDRYWQVLAGKILAGSILAGTILVGTIMAGTMILAVNGRYWQVPTGSYS